MSETSNPSEQQSVANPEPEKLQTASEPQAQPEKKRKATKAAKPRSFSAVLPLTVLLLLAATAGLGFFYFEQQKALDVLFAEYNRLTAGQTGLGQQLDALTSDQSSQLTALQQQLADGAQQLAAQNARLDELNRQLVDTRLKVSQQSGVADNGWMLAEAQSLLRLARQRLLSGRDLNTALSLMLEADDVLKQINDPAVQSVRAILLNDMDALRGVQLPDIQGLHQRLGSLPARLDMLSLVADDGRVLSFSAPPTQDADAEAGWFDDIRNSLGQYFVISREGAPAMPRPSPEQLQMTRDLARLQVEQARIALLQGNARVYRAVLEQLLSLVEQNMQGEGRDTVLQAIRQLRDAEILAAIPPTGNALNALSQIVPSQLAGETEQ